MFLPTVIFPLLGAFWALVAVGMTVPPGTSLPIQMSLVDGAEAILDAHSIWHPNQTALALQDFSGITEQAAHVASDMEAWEESGLKLEDIVSLSIREDSDVAVYGGHDKNPCRKKPKKQNCHSCGTCQKACLALIWCLPCCMFLLLLHSHDTHAFELC